MLYTRRRSTGNLLLLYYLLFSAILGLKVAVSLDASDKLLNTPACQEYSRFNKHHYLSVLEHQSLIHKLRQVLHGQHIVFIGDSLTRYFYISLVYALKYSRFNNDTIVPNIVKEEEWGNYNYFYGNSTKVLAPEHCDCYRGKLSSPYNFENRYFYDDSHSFNLTYYQYWGHDIHGHWQDHGDYDILRAPLARQFTTGCYFLTNRRKKSRIPPF